MIQIDTKKCCGCSYCVLLCPVKAISSYYTAEVKENCTDCGICFHSCPNNAITITLEDA